MTKNDLIEILNYNETTGVFTWKNLSKFSPIKSGEIAGSKTGSNGYVNIKINKKLYLAHRLAWLYVTGVYPEKIDHKDHDGYNNIFTNLRNVSHAENMKNKSKYKCNKYPNGISYHKRDKKFQAYITIAGKMNHLGYFKTENEALDARKEAETKHDFHKNHGN